jgi:hypothetical protein
MLDVLYLSSLAPGIGLKRVETLQQFEMDLA